MDVQFSTTKNHKACKGTGKYGPLKGKNNERNHYFWFLEEAQTLELVNKDFKSVILNILKELMESMDKQLKEFRKMM